ncbi:hypothetical protein C9374_009540 [Naegleria lovaniensis]|uniref:Uncharacterized protein n=1 Tax=Naegleria lovaniensis TaxID=51637 RepID=A0AA88KPA0_NAELO|nr:uncharacterized protein C9374_009540 [Naegleria lovaniensis]KAG2392963.1 hypothetical protein C9374_009540 [Naegleria lovaniensis]
MKKFEVLVVADFLKKLNKETNTQLTTGSEEQQQLVVHRSSSDVSFDIGLIFSMPAAEESASSEEKLSSSSSILVHHVSLISTLEEGKAKNGGFSSLSSEWFHQQIQIVQQALLSSVNISGMYLRDYSYAVKDRLNDVIALYMRSIESLQPTDATSSNPVYFVNVLKEGQDVFVFEKGKFRQDITAVFTESPTARKISEYSCVLPYYKKLKSSKNIDALLDEIENQLEDSLANDYLWKVNKTTKRIECFLNTRAESKLPEINQEGDMIEIVLCGTISGMVLTLDGFSYSDEDLIKELKKDIIQGVTTRIAFDDQLAKGVSSNSIVVNRNLLKRFYIHDSVTNIIYCDYSEDVDSIGIIEAIPSLMDQSHAFVMDVEGNTFSKKKLYDESSKEKVTETKKSKEGKAITESVSSTSSNEGIFAWFFAFIAFLMSLLGIKSQTSTN